MAGELLFRFPVGLLEGDGMVGRKVEAGLPSPPLEDEGELDTFLLGLMKSPMRSMSGLLGR